MLRRLIARILSATQQSTQGGPDENADRRSSGSTADLHQGSPEGSVAGSDEATSHAQGAGEGAGQGCPEDTASAARAVEGRDRAHSSGGGDAAEDGATGRGRRSDQGEGRPAVVPDEPGPSEVQQAEPGAQGSAKGTVGLCHPAAHPDLEGNIRVLTLMLVQTRPGQWLAVHAEGCPMRPCLCWPLFTLPLEVC